MKDQKRDRLVKQFKKEITGQMAEIERYGSVNWDALAVGWGIAKGLTPSVARELAVYIRYKAGWTP
jgi:hypothetical protein